MIDYADLSYLIIAAFLPCPVPCAGTDRERIGATAMPGKLRKFV